jgi:hypothetical protein
MPLVGVRRVVTRSGRVAVGETMSVTSGRGVGRRVETVMIGLATVIAIVMIVVEVGRMAILEAVMIAIGIGLVAVIVKTIEVGSGSQVVAIGMLIVIAGVVVALMTMIVSLRRWIG